MKFDPLRTGALPDRLTHHVHILEMNGNSYGLATSQKRARKREALAQSEPNIHADKSEEGEPPAKTKWRGLACTSVAALRWYRQMK